MVHYPQPRPWVTLESEARGDLLSKICRNSSIKVIYFHGWDGFGTAPVLRSVAQKVLDDLKAPPKETWFDRIVYLDCSAWNGRRAMQRVIAEEIKLGNETMALLDKQDEEDDFDGVDQRSRDVVRGVATMIYETLKDSKFLILFLNGSDEEIDVATMGVPPFSEFRNHAMIWAFRRRSLTINFRSRMSMRADKCRYTQDFYGCRDELRIRRIFNSVLDGEVAAIVARYPFLRSIHAANTMVKDCCLYELCLHYNFHRITKYDWVAQASNYWICDGIIKEDTAKEISDSLHREITWECDSVYLLDEVLTNVMLGTKPPFLWAVKEGGLGYEEGPYRWISVTSRNLEAHGVREIPAVTSSFFLAFETPNSPTNLPASLFTNARYLGLLVLCHCAFSFASPPFFVCQALRFLGLDHCTDDTTSHSSGQWATLCGLYVLDLRYTVWNEIFSQEKLELMINLRELHVEGSRCWPDNTHLQGRLLNLEKLRIIKSQGETLTDISTSFMDKTKLEILDLSGSLWVTVLPASLSKACSLKVLVLDGCEELETVVIPDALPSSLISFSFDSYGPASRKWIPCVELPPSNLRPSSADEKQAKASKISLEGCTLLENLFLRGLPNLVELDLSGTAIKMLNFETMVVQVPGLKRLFLIGCENLRAIIWNKRCFNLELLCIDTRAGIRHPWPSLGLDQKKSFRLHAVLVDARLVRSLYFPIENRMTARSENFQFSIHFTSSSINSGGALQFEGPCKEKIKPSHHLRPQVVPTIPYVDVPDVGGDVPMQDFPQLLPPASAVNRYIEVAQGSHSLESELAVAHKELHDIMASHAEFLHVHDVSMSASLHFVYYPGVRWCRVERCSNMETIFSAASTSFGQMETFWASDLPKARYIWCKSSKPDWMDRGDYRSFVNLRHLHLRSCPRLEFVLHADGTYSFPSLETLNIIHCSELRHVFVLKMTYSRRRRDIATYGATFPKLTTIRLQDLPLLQQICVVKMVTPMLHTVKVSGCWAMHRLSTVIATGGQEKKPTVEMEKEVWDALEWDGPEAGHHHSLFEVRHSHYYKKKLVRGALLR
ncbi:hypothetical protein SETIT_7G050700v2 [Setaria italica]|uniref:Disease resistance protein At4g27190-like leucine-rich repeats domain-containing protein n=1 Tax=Setaria italica TaxID=4555 RepID=A0A368RS20_SETIT|nr:uncharacterized protein LOC101784915 [Setaria italica]RCV33037.1 hypothetical protein SETIT_7G050700v2 [Setaria italica]